MPASTAELEHFGARGAQRLRLTGHDRVDQHSGLDSVRAPLFIRADLTTLHRSYSPSLDGIAWQPIRRDAAVAERRRIMRQASGWLKGWTDTVLPLWPRAARNVIGEG